MLLRDLKEGEIYAYIEDYGRMTRYQNAYCGNLPPARAMEVVQKEKRLVEIRKDSCGRPKLQSRTFVICKLFNVDPTDMMAEALDIVEDKHSDLVTFDIEVNPADLIWPWEMEVAQARENAEIMRQVDLRVAYVEGIGQRMTRWLTEAEWPILDAVCARALQEAELENHKGVDRKEMIERYASLHQKVHLEVGYLKQVAYSFLKDEDETVQFHGRDIVSIEARVIAPSAATWDNRGISLGRITNLGFARKVHVAVRLFTLENACQDMEGFEAWSELAETMRQHNSCRGDTINLSTEQYRDTYNKLEALEIQMKEEFFALSKVEKLSVLDVGLNRLKEKAEKEFGKRLPKFNSKKNWIAWAAVEKKDAEAAKKG